MSDPLATVRSLEPAAGNGSRLRDRTARRPEEGSRMERDKMLGVTLSQIERQFGKGAVMRLGEHPAGQGVSVIPTGSLALDIALGIGGVPRGRGIQGFGAGGACKSPGGLRTSAGAQSHAG